jgi:hypothetical protein
VKESSICRPVEIKIAPNNARIRLSPIPVMDLMDIASISLDPNEPG